MKRRKANLNLVNRAPKNTHRIWWISKNTGFNDNGSWTSEGSASYGAKDANRRFPDIIHIVEDRNLRKSNSRIRKHFTKLFPAKNPS